MDSCDISKALADVRSIVRLTLSPTRLTITLSSTTTAITTIVSTVAAVPYLSFLELNFFIGLSAATDLFPFFPSALTSSVIISSAFTSEALFTAPCDEGVLFFFLLLI